MSTTPHDYATRKALWVASLAIDQWEDERDKIHALATCLVSALAPVDPKDPDDNDRLIEWRLAQVIEQMLGSTASLSETRNLVTEATK